MTGFSCGCPLEPQYHAQRCDDHRFWVCHTIDKKYPERRCPPCIRRHYLSLSLSPQATPTRKRR
jgi:hypothetical protein